MATSTTDQPSLAGSFQATATPVLFGATILTSACLLFLVQPLSSKLILPWFGGSAAVWITCMLFFQAGLLAGYLYAHILTSFLAPKQQAITHAVLLLASLAVLPILPNPIWQPKPGEDPTWRVFAVLATSTGLPYFLLSATSPLLQTWYAARQAGVIPYRYFALSNAGSMLALLAYPILVEPNINGRRQAWSWSGAYFAFALLCTAVAVLSARRPQAAVVSLDDDSATKLAPITVLLWLALAACASTLLLTVTNLLTQNIAPMPLLWVVPLSIYLLSFILCFESSRWYQRYLFIPLLPAALWYLASHTETIETEQVKRVVPLICASLFVCCMVCHGELARLKPAVKHLTAFYLGLSAGGVIGGLFVALFAPHVFSASYEFPISYVFCAALVLLVLWHGRAFWWKWRILAQSVWCAGAAGTLALAGYAWHETSADREPTSFTTRNFYGPLLVEDSTDGQLRIRELSHGTIIHGLQILDPRMRHVATTYYGRESGIGLTWRLLEKTGPLKIGVVGLGAGTTAAYGRAGDTFRFYDLNPLVVGIARKNFTFLSDSPAHIDIVLGDARLSMAAEPAQQFDILVIDAFAGDAIPVHLLTREAFQIYWRHLKPDGVLAVHVSNQYLDLPPIVALGAQALHKQAWQVENDQDDSTEVYSATYVLVSNRPGFFDDPLMHDRIVAVPVKPGLRPWTDDFTNLWQVLKLGN